MDIREGGRIAKKSAGAPRAGEDGTQVEPGSLRGTEGIGEFSGSRDSDRYSRFGRGPRRILPFLDPGEAEGGDEAVIEDSLPSYPSRDPERGRPSPTEPPAARRRTREAGIHTHREEGLTSPDLRARARARVASRRSDLDHLR